MPPLMCTEDDKLNVRCQHSGKCVRSGTQLTCDCTNTGFKGDKCGNISTY